MIKKNTHRFSTEKVVDVLQTCSEVLMSFYHDTNEYGALLASQEAENVKHDLMCSLTIDSPLESLH